MNRLIPIVALLALAGCASGSISNGPVTADLLNLLPTALKSATVADMKATATNFDNAATAGIMPATDDAGLCQHMINQQFGVEVVPGAAPPKTATVTNAGPISAGSIAIIEAYKLAGAAQGGVNIPENCLLALAKVNFKGLGALFGVNVNFTPAMTQAQMQTALAPVAPAPSK